MLKLRFLLLLTVILGLPVSSWAAAATDNAATGTPGTNGAPGAPGTPGTDGDDANAVVSSSDAVNGATAIGGSGAFGGDGGAGVGANGDGGAAGDGGSGGSANAEATATAGGTASARAFGGNAGTGGKGGGGAGAGSDGAFGNPGLAGNGRAVTQMQGAGTATAQADGGRGGVARFNGGNAGSDGGDGEAEAHIVATGAGGGFARASSSGGNGGTGDIGGAGGDAWALATAQTETGLAAALAASDSGSGENQGGFFGSQGAGGTSSSLAEARSASGAADAQSYAEQSAAAIDRLPHATARATALASQSDARAVATLRAGGGPANGRTFSLFSTARSSGDQDLDVFATAGSGSALPSLPGDVDAFMLAAVAPTSQELAAIMNGNANLSLRVATAEALIVASFGGLTTAGGVTDFAIDGQLEGAAIVAENPQAKIGIAFANPVFSGGTFGELRVFVGNPLGFNLIDETFTTIADAEAFFDDTYVNLGIPPFLDFDLEFSALLSGGDVGASFRADLVVFLVPEPSIRWLLAALASAAVVTRWFATRPCRAS